MNFKNFNCKILKIKRHTGGAEGSRTPDLDDANVALYQLSYDPNVKKVKREHVSQ